MTNPSKARFVCSHCGEAIPKLPRHDYMLKDEVWQVVHPEGPSGFLHDTCLQHRAAEHGVTLDAAAFTVCLCYVNRHIHLPTHMELFAELARRRTVNLQQDRDRARSTLHFGVYLARWGRQLAEEDRTMSFEAKPSVFHGLFRSSSSELGDVWPPLMFT